MTSVLSPEARDLLRSPFSVEKPQERIGDALWLYVSLLAHANTFGIVCRARATLATELQTDESRIDAWVERLEAAKLIQVLTPSPYLALKLLSWPRDARNAVENGLQTGSRNAVQSNVPVGLASMLAAASSENISTASKQGDRGLGEGEELLADVLALIEPGTPVSDVRSLMTRYPEFIVRDALQRVLETPIHRIRKSRFALFVYLLVKLSQEQQFTPSPHDPNTPH